MESSKHQSHTNQMQADFIALAIQNVGEGLFKDCSNEQFEDIEEEAHEQFYLEEEEQQIKGIKTAEFNKFLNLGYQKVSNQTEKELDQLAVKGYNFVHGFNDGPRTVELIQGHLCRAIGVNIFFQGQIYPSQADRNDQLGHNYLICYLNYDPGNKLLYSGSNGKCSEIIEWSYHSGQRTLCFMRKMTLPSSSLGVAFTFKNNSIIYCITKWSLHQPSQLFSFDPVSRRTRHQAALSKVVALCEALDVFLINEKGLHMLAENQKGFDVVKVCQSEQLATALGKVGSEYLLVGLMDGSVQFVSPKAKTVIARVSVTHGAILAINMIDKFKFAVSTSHKQLTVFETDHKVKGSKTIATFQLDDVAKNIHCTENSFLCCLRGGKIEKFQLKDEKIEKKTNPIEQVFYLGFSSQYQPIICFNKAASKYFYSIKGKNKVIIFQLDQHNLIQKATNIEFSHPICLIDSHGTTLACILEPSSLKDKQTHQIIEFYDFISQKTLFLIQELPFNNCNFIKFNPDGDKLALGFGNGAIVILNTNIYKDSKEICRSQTQKLEGLNHITPIQNIIWSADGRLLKTLSHRNLLFFGLSKKNDDIYELSLYDGKKSAEKQALKAALVKSEWTEMGKFNWRTSKIWARANSVQEYVQIVQSKGFLIACLQDGKMQAYSNPAAEEYHLLCQWFTGPYTCKVLQQREEGVSLLLMSGGVLTSVNIS